MLEIRKLYDFHDDGCTCGDCSGDLATLADFDNTFRRIAKNILDQYTDEVYNQVVDGQNLSKAIWSEHYSRLRQFAEAGYGRKFTEARTRAELDLMQRINQNISRFAAHKQQAMTVELRRLLVNAQGQKVSLVEFREAAKKVIRRHNITYLRTELNTTAQAAQAAESWQEFQNRKFLYPNLRYETVGDARVREAHRALDGAVYPVDHPFWDVYYPPNGWRCRCKVLQTDSPAKEMEADFEPSKGFRQNVGKTGLLFDDQHPYFKVGTLTAEKLDQQANDWLAALEKDTLRKLAIERHAGEQFYIPQLPQPIRLGKALIENLFEQPHPHASIRNYLLAHFNLVYKELEYVSQTTEEATIWHYLMELSEGKFYFNILELKGEREFEIAYILQSITDKI